MSAPLAGPGERFRAALATGDVLVGAAAVLALAAAAGRSLAEGLPLAGLFAVMFAVARVGFARAESDGLREDAPRGPGLTRRLVGVYAAVSGVMLLVYPDAAPAGLLVLLAFAHAVMLASPDDPLVRAAADWNAALLVGGANATAGGDVVVAPSALYLLLLPIGLALRRFEAAARAAEVDGPDELGPALRVGGASGAALAGFYALAGAILPARTAARVAGGRALPAPEGAGPGWDRIPWREVGELALALLAAALLLAAYAWVMRRLRPAAVSRARGPDAELALSPPEPLERPPAPPLAAPARGPRAAVVAEYRRFEEMLAARDLGRAPCEGAGEHARALARRFGGAAADLGEVARRFAEARYGPEDVPEEAALAIREAARRALEGIERADGSP
jgi:hypothetical protein